MQGTKETMYHNNSFSPLEAITSKNHRYFATLPSVWDCLYQLNEDEDEQISESQGVLSTYQLEEERTSKVDVTKEYPQSSRRPGTPQ